jgi:hypothetical protein
VGGREWASRRLRSVVSACLLVLTAIAVSASLAIAAAPGNNGTVKIHDGPSEPSPITRDEPHVCTFHLHFFFADGDQTGVWQIESWPPTGDRSAVLSGTYATDANGQDRQPETGAYGLPDGHYKLSWMGSTDHTWKQKVFWVDCAATISPSPSPSGSGEAAISPSPSASAPSSPGSSASPGGSVSPAVSAGPTYTGEVEPIVTPPATSMTASSAMSSTALEVTILLLLVFSAAMQAIRLVAVLGIRGR